MNLIQIQGTEATVRGLKDIPDLILVLPSGAVLPGGELSVSAYATDRAITEIEGRGATVEVVMDNDAFREHMDELFALLPDDEPPVG